MQLFLDYGADPNVVIFLGQITLHILISRFSDVTDPEVATLLRTFMERGADIKVKDERGESVLELAQHRSSALAAFLLESRPNQGFPRTKVLRRGIKTKVRFLCYHWGEFLDDHILGL